MDAYNVAFTIRDVKNMVGSEALNPLVVVRCGGQEFRTDIKYDKVGLVNFDCSHSWPNLPFASHVFDHAIIEFELQSANAFWANTIIGKASLQLKTIKNHANHSISGYIPLIGANDSTTTGNINLSVSVLSPGDVIRAEDDYEGAGALDDTFDTAIIKSGNAEQHGIPHIVTISIYRVEFASETPMDLYLTCEFAGCQVKSSVKHGANGASFNEGFKIPLTTPIPEDSISLAVWDDRYRPAKLLAQGSLSFLTISAKAVAPRWFNLYGFSPGEAANFTPADWELISKQNVEGTAFLGRLMLSANVQKLRSYAQLGKAELIIAKTKSEGTLSVITYFAEVYEAEINEQKLNESRRSPPAILDNVKVVVSSGATSVRSGSASKTSQRNGTHRFSFGASDRSGTLPALVQQLSGEEKYHPNVFVELFCGSERIGYRRFTAQEIPEVGGDNQTCPPMWIPLRNPFLFYNDNLPASLLISLNKGRGEGVSRKRRRRIVAANYVLRCYIYAARYLQFGERGAIPDPYVEVSCAGVAETTKQANETRFPVWLQTLELPCRLMLDANDGIPALCPVVVEVKHGGKCLGCAIAGYSRLVGRRQIRTGSIEAIKPSWIELKTADALLTNRTQSRGHILLAIEILRRQDAPLVPPQSLRPHLMDVTFRVSLWGLRNVLGQLKPEFPPLAFTDASMRQCLESDEVSNPVVEVRLPNYDSGNDHVLAMPWLSIADLKVDVDDSNAHRYLQNSSWRETEFTQAFDFHFVSGVQIQLPSYPILDPHVVFRVKDGSALIGEAAIPLFSLLPWFQPANTPNYLRCKEQLVAQKSFQETPNLAVLKEAYDTAMTNMRRENLEHEFNSASSVSNQKLPMKVMREAELQELSSFSTAASLENIDRTQDVDDVCENGVPVATRVADLELAQSGYLTNPFVARMLNPGIWIPRDGMIFVEGRKKHRVSAEVARDVAEGGVEASLTDVYWCPRILWRPNPVDVADWIKGGSIKVEIALTDSNMNTTASVPADFVKTAFTNKRLRQSFRPASNVELIRVRVYLLRIAAISVPFTVTKDAVYGYPHAANHPVEIRVQVSDKKLDSFMSKTDGPNPKFNALHELDVRLPEESVITISVWSLPPRSDPVFVGLTRIDITDRQYSAQYNDQMEALKAPVEIRPLRLHDTSPICTGSLEMLMEVFKSSLAIPRMPLPDDRPVSAELRLIIWGCRGLTLSEVDDEEEDATINEPSLADKKPASLDVKVRSILECSNFKGDQPQSQETDVHYGSTNGNTVYNYRCVFSGIELPCKSAILTLQALQFKPFGAERVIGQVNIELKSYLAQFTHRTDKQSYDVELKLTDQDNKVTGFLQITFQFLSQTQANTKPAGLAQLPPNQDPVLTTPIVGRRWADFLGAAGTSLPFNYLWLQVRWISVVICFGLVFFIGCIKPGIFWTL